MNRFYFTCTSLRMKGAFLLGGALSAGLFPATASAEPYLPQPSAVAPTSSPVPSPTAMPSYSASPVSSYSPTSYYTEPSPSPKPDVPGPSRAPDCLTTLLTLKLIAGNDGIRCKTDGKIVNASYESGENYCWEENVLCDDEKSPAMYGLNYGACKQCSNSRK